MADKYYTKLRNLERSMAKETSFFGHCRLQHEFDKTMKLHLAAIEAKEDAIIKAMQAT